MLKYIAIFIACLFAAPLQGQDYQNYKEIDKYRIDSTFSIGTYYILVSADWCAPCKVLKEQLKAYPDTVIYYVDYDKETSLATRLMAGEKGLPFFAKFEVKQNRIDKVRYSNNGLQNFIESTQIAKVKPPTPKPDVVETPPQVVEAPKEEPKPVENIFNRISERMAALEAATNNKLSEMQEERQGIVSRITSLINSNNLNFLSVNSKVESLNILTGSVRDSVRELSSKFEAAATERRTLLEELRNFRSERQNFVVELNEVRQERVGILAQLREARENQQGLFQRLVDASKERQGLLDRLITQERKFKPLQNIVDRFNGLIVNLTSSVWYILGFIVSVLIGLVIILAIVSAILSVFKTIGIYLLAKIGLKSII